MVWWIVEGYPEGIQFSNFPSTNWIPWSPRLTFRSACPLRRKVGKRPLAAWQFIFPLLSGFFPSFYLRHPGSMAVPS